MKNIEASVKETLAELTNYPDEVLEEHADWERDLGLDAARRGEIFAALRNRFNLPPAAKLSPDRAATITVVADTIRRLIANGHPRTIDFQDLERRVVKAIPGLIREVLREMSGEGDGTHSNEPPSKGHPSVTEGADVVSSPLSRNEIESIVLNVIAELTRYPMDILHTSADLEEELGIDSVKRSEILATLLARFDLTPDAEREPISPPRTIEDVVNLTIRFAERVGSGQDTQPRITPASVSNNNYNTTFHHSANGKLPAKVAPRENPILPYIRSYAGKVALVTGSGRGIGRVIALELARLGAHVVVNSFYSRQRGEETTEEIRAAGGDATHVWGSVANAQHLERIFEEIGSCVGFLDFYVHNASNGVLTTLDKVTPDAWDKAFRTNVVAFHQGALAAAKLMRTRGGGRIITISSPGAQRYIEYFGCLGPVKAALESLTRYLAVELGPQNITVNAVSAGPIYGELMDLYPEGDRLIPHWEALATDRRLGNPEDIADIVRYLLSDSAHKINGQVMLVDGAASLPL